MKKRFFAKISYEQYKKDFIKPTLKDYEQLLLPQRATKTAAGYDFYAPFSFNLEPGAIIKIPMGIKVKMASNEVLIIVVRSSIGFKYNIRLCNQVAIIDSDYYNNIQNEGHIFMAFQNEGLTTWSVKQGERLVQGIFLNYLTAGETEEKTKIRTGGIGSTTEKEIKL